MRSFPVLRMRFLLAPGAHLLHLHGRDGSRRTYALEDDGSLQACDSHGRPLPVQDDATLTPFAP